MRLSLLAALTVLLSLPAHAGVFDVSAVLELNAPFGVSTLATGSASGVQSIGGGIAAVPQIPISTTLAVTAPIYTGVGISEVQIQATLGSGTLTGGGGSLGVVGPATVFVSGGAPALLLPLDSIGGGGSGVGVLGGIFPVTLAGSVWQLGPVFASGTGTTLATGVDNRTAGGAGTITFVTPSVFSFSGTASITEPAASVLTLTYVLAAPEPAIPLLALVGGLIMVRARR